MNSILAVVTLIAVLSLCNLSDKTKTSDNSNAPNTNNSQTQGNATDNNHPDSRGSDREAVQAELLRIEKEVTDAAFSGDISTVSRYVAEDYAGTGADGSTQNKNQLLAGIKPDKITKSWKMTEIELVSLSEDAAVLTYIQSQTLRDGRTFRFRMTDTFTKRSGHWLVKSEQQTIMK